MRVTERDGASSAQGAARREAPPGRFREALRRAGASPRREGSVAKGAAGSASLAASRTPAARRAAADRVDEVLVERRDAFREEARAAPPPGDPAATARPAEPVTTPELRALVRTLPVAIQTFGLRDGAPLALSFGRSLDVEIRPAPRGVELVLRPEPRLVRASEAELRGVVAALEARGIAVARAAVRGRTGAQGGGARVDLAPGVR